MVLLVVAAGNYVSGVAHDLFRVWAQHTNSIYPVLEFGIIFPALAYDAIIFIRSLSLVLFIVILW